MYMYTYAQNLLLRPSAGLTNYRLGEQSSRRSLPRDESSHHHQRAMEAGTAPPPGGADGGAPSGGAPAASRKHKAAPEEHWSKKLKGQAFVLKVENVADKGARGTWSTVGGRRSGASHCGSSGKTVSESAEKCIFSRRKPAS